MTVRGARRCRAFLGSNCLGALGPWLDELPRRPARAVVIPTASKHYGEVPWVPWTFRKLAGLGVGAGLFDLDGASRETVAERLTTDLIFVTGGDALFLLKHAQLSGFSELAAPLIRAGRLAYAGVSAGAMLAGPDLVHCIDPDEPGDEVPASTRGLGVAPVVTLPHANRDGRDALHARIISALGHRLEFARITDDQAIVVTGDAWEVRPSPCRAGVEAQAQAARAPHARTEIRWFWRRSWWQASVMARDVTWWPAGPGASGSVTALTVSYNTRELTAFLLWSLRTIVSWPELEIVVVDNGSRDGSAQLLAEAERGGVCTLLANHGNRHHGPGLNQGISYLASRPGPRPGWIWILDSDVVAARPDALSAAVAVAREHPAALVGEPQHDQWHPDGRFGQYSLLMDPAVVWPEQPGPFTAGGDPSSSLLTSAARLGIPMAPFPFTAAGHIIHRGRGSLAAVYAAGDRSHPFYEWAAGHHAPHFAGVPGADQRYQSLRQEFRKQTGPLTGATLAAACRPAPGDG